MKYLLYGWLNYHVHCQRFVVVVVVVVVAKDSNTDLTELTTSIGNAFLSFVFFFFSFCERDLVGYTNSDLTDGPMEIDNVTGEIRVNSTFDFEDERFYNVTATAYDMVTPSLTATASIVLTVEPENEFDPVWTSGTDFTVSEDTLPGRYIGCSA